MKSIYGKQESYTKEASELDREIDKALRPIFDKWIADDYPVREIAHVAYGAVISIECYRVVKAAIDARKKERSCSGCGEAIRIGELSEPHGEDGRRHSGPCHTK